MKTEGENKIEWFIPKKEDHFFVRVLKIFVLIILLIVFMAFAWAFIKTLTN